ncbi:MAG TPA: UMP kinase, partial [Candidatus Paceibacterota bacterium]|nr:UMP kinase [Candidatus Paceibacterota bacterium]
MKHLFGKKVVIALGGSIVYPAEIDVRYLKQFKKFAEREIRRGRKLVIVIGGGRLARIFQSAAHEVSPLTDEDKDWIGIHATRLNAHLLRTIFRRVADPVVFDHRGKFKKLDYPVTIASGWRPGWSTDFVAAAIAHDFDIPEFIVAGKPAFVYQKDPSIYKDAKPFKTIG